MSYDSITGSSVMSGSVDLPCVRSLLSICWVMAFSVGQLRCLFVHVYGGGVGCVKEDTGIDVVIDGA